MDFELTPEQEELRRSARAALLQAAPVAVAREVVESGARPDQPWKTACELGWAGASIPEHAGGLGLGAIELALLCEEHGRVLATGPFLATTAQFVPLVREAGTEAQIERFLGPVAAGAATGAVAWSNRAGRCDRPDDGMTATRQGDEWILRGARHWAMHADAADEIAIVAQVGSGDGVGLFVVPRSSADVRAVRSLDASRPLCVVALQDVAIGAERALGTPGQGARALERALEEGTLALASETVGSCQTLFDTTVEYAKHRKQFGQPIGAFQAIQHKLADLFIAIEKARSTCLFAAMVLAENDERRPLAASMAKASAGDCQRAVAKEAIQIHGGLGYTWEQDVHLFVKRVQAGDRLLGTSAEHRSRIAGFLGV